jgi:CubicO group peptidase (beta-lactamase class C family)
MRPGRLSTLVFLLFFGAPPLVSADRTDDYIRDQMESFHLPGLSLVVVRDGQVIKVQGYGVADVEHRISARPETVYKIGSVSKQFIATGIMLLAQEGRLRIDEPISKYLRGTPPAWASITIRHLLTHTSGLVRESPGFDPFKTQSDADILAASYAVPLLFPVGARWEYSNLGYYALAEIVHAASGRPWNEYLSERVFKPAGMATTLLANTKQTVANRAKGYGGKDNARAADDWTALRPSGAFLSTVLDLAKWEALLLTDRILTDASRREMSTPVRLNSGATEPYGLGWHVDSWNGQRRLWHGGGIPGFASHYVRFPEIGLALIALANGDDVDLGAIVNGLADSVYWPQQASAPK